MTLARPDHKRYRPLALFLLVGLLAPLARATTLPGFRKSPWWGEQVYAERMKDGVRVLINGPAAFDPGKPTRLAVYATPNGNTLEQTLGCVRAPGLDWHFDIQHIAAQTRRWREVDRRENLFLAVVEAPGRSWPAWRNRTPDANARIRSLVEDIRKRIPGEPRVTLCAHSGGGSFLFGFIEAADALPDWVDRLAFLDANYAFDAGRHGGKLQAWLSGNTDRHLVVLAYDDRTITLDGKPVVGPEGGTFRATQRMRDSLEKAFPLSPSRSGDLDTWTGIGGQARFLVDCNPKNRILHTVLVETNGFLYAMTAGTPEEGAWGKYRGARAYARWIQPHEAEAPVGTFRMDAIPPRRPDARGGAALLARVDGLPVAGRETVLLGEVLRGNVPDALRTYKIIETKCIDVRGRRHVGRIAVMPDVLAVGNDADFVRVPLTPMTAQRIADAFGCVLMTRRLSDAVHHAAEARLEPRPLTVDREAVATFVQHNALIAEQLRGKPPGALVADDKKDVVLTNRLDGTPHRVAIYGWHFPDGTPIQPLYTGHIDTYVDYSHGIRLVARQVTVDGRAMDIAGVLRDPDLCPLVSDEGPLASLSYPLAWP